MFVTEIQVNKLISHSHSGKPPPAPVVWGPAGVPAGVSQTPSSGEPTRRSLGTCSRVSLLTLETDSPARDSPQGACRAVPPRRDRQRWERGFSPRAEPGTGEVLGVEVHLGCDRGWDVHGSSPERPPSTRKKPPGPLMVQAFPKTSQPAWPRPGVQRSPGRPVHARSPRSRAQKEQRPGWRLSFPGGGGAARRMCGSRLPRD